MSADAAKVRLCISFEETLPKAFVWNATLAFYVKITEAASHMPTVNAHRPPICYLLYREMLCQSAIESVEIYFHE